MKTFSKIAAAVMGVLLLAAPAAPAITLYGTLNGAIAPAPAGMPVTISRSAGVNLYPSFGTKQTITVYTTTNGYWFASPLSAGTYVVTDGTYGDQATIAVPNNTNSYNFLDLLSPPNQLATVNASTFYLATNGDGEFLFGIPLSALDPSGATDGQVATFNGTSWAPGAGGGGGGSATNATLLNNVNGPLNLTFINEQGPSNGVSAAIVGTNFTVYITNSATASPAAAAALDTIVSNGVVTFFNGQLTTTSNAFAALDTVVSNGVVTFFNGQLTTTSNAFAALSTVVSNGVVTFFNGQLTITSNAFAALSTIVSNGVVAYDNATFAPLASPTFTGTVTAPAFAGNLTGNVTGNASGTAATITGSLAYANVSGISGAAANYLLGINPAGNGLIFTAEGGGSQTPIAQNVNGAGYTGYDWGLLQANTINSGIETNTNGATFLAGITNNSTQGFNGNGVGLTNLNGASIQNNSIPTNAMLAYFANQYLHGTSGHAPVFTVNQNNINAVLTFMAGTQVFVEPGSCDNNIQMILSNGPAGGTNTAGYILGTNTFYAPMATTNYTVTFGTWGCPISGTIASAGLALTHLSSPSLLWASNQTVNGFLVVINSGGIAPAANNSYPSQMTVAGGN